MKKLITWGFCLFGAGSLGWHAWLVFIQHDADKAGVFLLVAAAMVVLVALYKTSQGK